MAGRRTLAASLLAAFLAPLLGCGPRAAPEAPTMAFQGRSTDLQRTVLVATLESPLPPGKSVIWCASFQMAWNRLKDDLVGEPVKLDKAAELVEQLNSAALTEADLPEGAYYATAGWVRDGIVDTIHAEMQRRFQKTPTIDLSPQRNVAVAYAYLQTRLEFTIPFFENRKPLLFTESEGEEVEVSSFGIRKEDEYAYMDLREQVEVLYATGEEGWPYGPQKEFALDLCKSSLPSQLVIARVPPKATFAETLQYVREKEESYRREGSERARIGRNEQILDPNMNWDIEHEFTELKHAVLQNGRGAGLSIEALQNIRFRLDRGGAELESEAAIPMQPTPRLFHVRGPFLVYLKRRDAERPFFVMWVDNAELLSKM